MAEGRNLVTTGTPDLPFSAATPSRKSVLFDELRQDRRVYLTALKIAKEVGGVFLGPLFTGGVTLLESFADAADDADLEASFEELRDLGTRSDEKLQALAALAQLILVKQDEIAERLERQGTPAERPIDEVAKAAALIAYRAEVAQRFYYADYRGIADTADEEHAASFAADGIYVTPRLHGEPGLRHEREREFDLHRRMERVHELDDEDRRKLEDELALLYQRRWIGSKEGGQEDGLLVGEALAGCRHAVIIGQPGVGKSALLRHLARTCACGIEVARDRLGWDEDLAPIHLPLAAYADARREEPQLSIAAYLRDTWCTKGSAVERALSEAVHLGKAIVLLDGVDEVPDETDRLNVVRAVDLFLGQHTKCRCIVTSRPAGYYRVAGDVSHFELRNFSAAQVEEFVGNWQRSFEQRRHREHPNFARAEAEAAQMVAEIQAHPRVAALARNPLMLVIIALIRHNQLRLPERRVELYQLAVRMLFDTWNRLRSEPKVDVGGARLPLERLLPVWGKVAEWMRRDQPTGFVHEEELKRKLIEVLEEDEEENPKQTAESYIRAVVNTAGILEERFPKRFAFWHPTFEEFLAAVSMSTPSATAADRLLRVRNDPRWREVIQLTVGYIGIIAHDQRTATDTLKAILSKDPDALELVTHQSLRLVVDCIADDVGARRGLVGQVLVLFVGILRRQPHEVLVNSFTKLVRFSARFSPNDEIIRSLEPLARDSNWQVRMPAIQLLSNYTSTNPTALALCRECLSDGDEDVRFHAAVGLARSGDYSSEVGKAIFDSVAIFADEAEEASELLREEQAQVSFLGADNAAVRFEVARLLIEQGRGDERVFEVLLSLLELEDASLSRSAAGLVIRQGRGDERVFKALVTLLEVDDPSARLNAAQLVIEQRRGDEQTFEVLRSLLGDNSTWIRLSAARLLIEQGRGDERVLQVLVALLGISDGWMHHQVVELLNEQGPAHEWVFAAVPSWLGADDASLRLGAARLQIERHRGEEQSFQALTSWLDSDNALLRLGAARLLVEQGRGDDRVFETVVSLLRADDGWLRLSVARLLIEQDRCGEPGFEVLESLLEADEAWLRVQAARLLIESGQRHEQVFEALVSWLGADDGWLLREAEELLIKQGRGNKWVFEALVTWVGTEDTTSAAGIAQRFFGETPLEDTDGERLAELVSIQNGDDRTQRGIRSVLFGLIAQHAGSAES